MLSIALLFAGSLGLVIESSRGLEAADQERLTELVSLELERATGERVVLETQVIPGCAEGPRASCQERARQRWGHEQLVVVLFIAAPTRIRVNAERVGRGAVFSRAEVDLARDRASWQSALRGWADTLFPLPPPPAPVVERPPPPLAAVAPPSSPPPREERSYVVPVAVAAAGVAAIAAGVFFELQSRSAHDQLSREDLPLSEATRLDDRMQSQGQIGTIALGTGTGLLGVSLLLLAIF